MLKRISLVFLMTVGGTTFAETTMALPLTHDTVEQLRQISPKKAIVFDLGGVIFNLTKFSLFGESYMSLIGRLNILGYVALDWKFPTSFQHVFFDVLDRVDLEEPHGIKRTCTASGEKLPYVICAYQAGRITSEEGRKKCLDVVDALSKAEPSYFVSKREEDMVRNAILATFTPDVHSKLTYVLDSGLELLKRVINEKDENGNEKFIPVAFTNWDKESIVRVKERFPEIFGLFKHVFVSGEIGSIKPNKCAFEHVLNFLQERYRIDLKNCYFVDDQAENVAAAVECGLQKENAFQYKSAYALSEEFENLKLLSPLPKGYDTRLVIASVALGAGLWYWIYHTPS